MQSTIPDEKPSIYDILNRLSVLERQAIVRPNNPPPGIAGYLFNITEEDEIRLQSQITNHNTEINSPVQDNIALAPIEYTVRGLVGELVAYADQVPDTPEDEVGLELNPDILPEFPPQALQTQEQIEATKQRITDSITASGSLYGFYNDQTTQPPNQTAQTKTLLYFMELWKGRQLFTIETPWGTLTNMVILTLRASQGEETKFRSSFTIVFQKFTFVGTITVNVGQLAGRAELQQAPVTQNGVAAKVPLTTEQRQSLLAGIYDMLKKTFP